MAEPATGSEAALSVPAATQPDTPTPASASDSQQSSLKISDTLVMVEKFCPVFVFHPKVRCHWLVHARSACLTASPACKELRVPVTNPTLSHATLVNRTPSCWRCKVSQRLDWPRKPASWQHR